VAYVEESLAAPEVLAGVELAGAGVALVCEAPLSAAGAFCAIAGMPKLAANRIAAIDPGVAVPLFTLSLCRPKTRFGRRQAHLSLPHLPNTIATGWPNGFNFAIIYLSI
jgi:hypothetical protein